MLPRSPYSVLRKEKTPVNHYLRRCNNIQFIYIYKLLYMFRVVSPPIIRNSYHCIYSIWHYCGRCVAVMTTIMSDTVHVVIWVPDDGWRYHPKHAEQFLDINKLYIVASCLDNYWHILRDARTIEHKKHVLFFGIKRYVCLLCKSIGRNTFTAPKINVGSWQPTGNIKFRSPSLT